MSDNVITVYAENQTILIAQDNKTVYAVLFGFLVSHVQNHICDNFNVCVREWGWSIILGLKKVINSASNFTKIHYLGLQIQIGLQYHNNDAWLFFEVESTSVVVLEEEKSQIFSMKKSQKSKWMAELSVVWWFLLFQSWDCWTHSHWALSGDSSKSYAV